MITAAKKNPDRASTWCHRRTVSFDNKESSIFHNDPDLFDGLIDDLTSQIVTVYLNYIII